jgi:hypothetical protein
MARRLIDLSELFSRKDPSGFGRGGARSPFSIDKVQSALGVVQPAR